MSIYSTSTSLPQVDRLSTNPWALGGHKSIARLKACLVAKGYPQTYGVDYYDTFPLIAKMTYIRLFISLITTYNWDLH